MSLKVHEERARKAYDELIELEGIDFDEIRTVPNEEVSKIIEDELENAGYADTDYTFNTLTYDYAAKKILADITVFDMRLVDTQKGKKKPNEAKEEATEN